MKKIFLVFCVTLFIFSCKKEAKNENQEINKENYPKEIGKILARHGGMNLWKNAKTLSFNVGDEVHTSDLKSRKIIINSPTYTIGFNGKKTWLTEIEKGAYKGNKDFYYNLYFYFYAMPFVLADDGITYQNVDSLTFDAKKYPGIKISFQENVGNSPDDNYIIYYNPDNYQMEWLAYTVTFRSNKPSDKYNLIRYNNWEKVEDLLLPKSIVWYNISEDGQPIEPARAPVDFTLPLISNSQLEASFFEKPKE